MKKLIIIMFLSLFLTGCFNTERQEELDIYTSIYPIEFATRRMYGHNSNVRSIYPDGVDIYEYELTEKQIEDYSVGDLFIFNSLSREKDYVIPMYLNNKNLKIIDAVETIDTAHAFEEIWLNPSNYLKLIANIKEGLLLEVSNHYLRNEIIENYEELRLEVSNISATLRRISQNAESITLLVGTDTFLFLNSFGFNVVSLENVDELSDRVRQEISDMKEDKTLKYIFVEKGFVITEYIENFIDETDIKIAELHTLSGLDEDERNNAETYITLMNKNIDKINMQLFD